MAIENSVKHVLNAFIWYRDDIPHSVSEAYWRDVHGIMVSRVPGLWVYRQTRLEPNRADLWPVVRGIDFDVRRAAQPHGIPHFLFRSEGDLSTFNDHTIIRKQIFMDERNFVNRVASQMSPLGSARTLVDRLYNPAPQGAPTVPTFALCFVPAPGVAVEAFHEYLTERVACPWSDGPGVMRLRVQPLPQYDANVWSSPSVSHEWPSERSYLGWIEIAVQDESVLRSLMRDVGVTHHARMIAAIHTYPVREAYTMISAGRPTEVALRGYQAVQTIIAAGAENQRTEEALTTVYGEAARGYRRLK